MEDKIEIIQRFDKILSKIVQLKDELKWQEKKKIITTTIKEINKYERIITK